PSWAHPFGTDQYGHDVFSRVLVAARLDLTIALSAVAFSLTIGVLIGAMAGVFGPWADEGLMRAQDVLQAFPRFVFPMAGAGPLHGHRGDRRDQRPGLRAPDAEPDAHRP